MKQISETIEIPYHLRSLNSAEVGGLLGYTAKHVRESLAAKPDFPSRCDTGGNPRWKASDILAWRDAVQKSRVTRKTKRKAL